MNEQTSKVHNAQRSVCRQWYRAEVDSAGSIVPRVCPAMRYWSVDDRANFALQSFEPYRVVLFYERQSLGDYVGKIGPAFGERIYNSDATPELAWPKLSSQRLKDYRNEAKGHRTQKMKALPYQVS